MTINGKPLEKLKVTIRAPADPAAAEFPAQLLLRPSDGSADLFGYQFDSPVGKSNLVPLALVDGSLVRQQGTNHKPDQAWHVTIPAQIVGRLEGKNDNDWYTFEAKKREKLWSEVTSQRLGLPVDPDLLVQLVTH